MKKAKTTTAKVVGGGALTLSGLLSVVIFLHQDIKAEISSKLVLVQQTTEAQIKTVDTKVEAEKDKVDEQFKAVQRTIDLQVKNNDQKMQAILNALKKLDDRLYNLNKKRDGT